MSWEIFVTNDFEEWFFQLTEPEQIDVMAMVEVLEIAGPNLSRPYADTLKATKRVKNLKELRIQHSGKPYRVFYAFDPIRRAVLLCGGRKNGSNAKSFYDTMIRRAEKLFLDHLKSENLD